MRAVVLTEHRPRLETAEVPEPVPGPDEVVLTVTGCGICGSDLHLASQMAPAGSVLGHEIAGVVNALGSRVDRGRWPIGTPVAARPFAGCGHCPSCARGRADHCARFELLGFERPGGFAELVAVRADELFALPAAVTADEQPLVEPLAVVRRAFRRGGITADDTVAVLGAGPIGLAAVAWAVATGVKVVAVSEPSALRRGLAARLGATAVLDPGEPALGARMAKATGGGPSVVLECSGRPGVIEKAIEMAAVEARIVVVGICAQPDEIFPFWAISKELDVRFSIYYGREDFTDTIDALDRHRIDAAPMVTETVGLDALPERFARLEHDADAGKVIVRPDR
ncbi:MAG TPA: alcohol dehydrogenase catalytic domain-containing protein [Acidimicrobiales bacterium]|nr:alcohol dehydrogenase catalytic domain-containing protein [Acidimicrobiales bacterium]